MGDFTLPPASTLIVGMTGSGKSTFAYEYLKKSPAACRFVFDNLGRAGTRLGIRPCYTAREVELVAAPFTLPPADHRNLAMGSLSPQPVPP